MNQTLISILTEEDEWCFHTDGRSIKFNKDGTGEVGISDPALSLVPKIIANYLKVMVPLQF